MNKALTALYIVLFIVPIFANGEGETSEPYAVQDLGQFVHIIDWHRHHIINKNEIVAVRGTSESPGYYSIEVALKVPGGVETEFYWQRILSTSRRSDYEGFFQLMAEALTEK